MIKNWWQKLRQKIVADWREQTTFLPEVNQSQDTRSKGVHHPMPHRLLQLMILLTILAVAWAYFGRTDIVVVAGGNILPHGQSKVVQSSVRGTIEKIHVQAGSAVQVGDILISLETEALRLQLAAVTKRRLQLRYHLAANDDFGHFLAMQTVPAAERVPFSERFLQAAILTAESENKTKTTPSARYFDKQADFYREWLYAQIAAYQSARATHKQARLVKQEAQAVLATELAALKAQLPMAEKKFQAAQTLHAADYLAEQSFLEAKSAWVEMQQSINILTARLAQLSEEVLSAETQIVEQFRRAQVNYFVEKETLQRDYETVQAEYLSQQKMWRDHIIRSPISGHVESLSVTTEGGVIEVAKPLMTIVPTNVTFEAKAFLANRDSGFVHENMPAVIKVQAYPYVHYGTLNATVKHIAREAIFDEQRGLVYPIILQFDPSTLNERGLVISQLNQVLPLRSGMEISAELRLGKRRLIEYFLAPLARHRAESFREK